MCSLPHLTRRSNPITSAQSTTVPHPSADAFFTPINCKPFYRTQVNLGSDLWVRMSVTTYKRLCRLILNANRAIQGNVAMQVTNYTTWWPTLQTMQIVPPNDQILNQSKLCHLLAKFATNANGAILWPNLQLMQVVPCCC